MLTHEELKELVKKHFSLVEVSEPTKEEVKEEKFGEIADINKAFKIKFPGDVLEVGSPVSVVTEEGQETPAPAGYHTLEDGKTIKVEDGKVTEIESAEEMKKEKMMDMPEQEKEGNKIADKETPDQNPLKMEEDKTAMIADLVSKAVSEVVKGELEMMKKELMEIKQKYSKLAESPASGKTLPNQIPTPKGPESFNIETAANADFLKAKLAEFKKSKK